MIPCIKNLRKSVHILKYISISFPGLESLVQRREGRSPHLFASYELHEKTGGVHNRCIYSNILHRPRGAFDLVDLDILLQRLKTRFGYRSDPLKWIRSCLSERTQVVTIDGVFSHRDTLTCNVPQGSVLGADFYSDFAAPVEETVKDVVSNHYYADDNYAKKLLWGRWKKQLVEWNHGWMQTYWSSIETKQRSW